MLGLIRSCVPRLVAAARVIAATVCLLSSNQAFAQPVPAPVPASRRVLAAVVIDADSRAPLAGASVSAADAHATTDPQGRFRVQVPAALVEVSVTAPGYLPLATTLDLRTSDINEAELALAREPTYATTVEVVAAPVAVSPATQAVEPRQVLRTPGALDNVFRALQTLPGVAATEEAGSRLAVRGGSPDQNLTVMDGVEIHDPYRLYGLTSAFNPETIARFELATGGFSVKHGDRLSSLLTVENRDGAAARTLGGSAALSITDANVVLEGGLPGPSTGAWLITARRTYYDLVAERFTDQDLPQFADLQARATWEPAPGKKLTLFGLRSRQAAAIALDEDDINGTFDDDTDNDLWSMRFDTSIGTRGQSHTVVGYSNTTSTFGVDAAFENQAQRSNTPDDRFATAAVVFDRVFSVEDLSLRQELAWTFGPHVLEVGADVHRLSTALDFTIAGDRNPTAANGSSVQGGAGLPDLLASRSQTTRGGAWVQDTWRVGARGSLEAGLRVDRVGLTSETLLSPRLAGRWSLGASTSLKGAVGRYTQSPGYEKLTQADYLLDLTSDAARDLRSERALHVSAGIEHRLGQGVVVKAEGYYKRFTDLLLGRLETGAELDARLAQYDFPAALASSIPSDPIITTVPTNDGRGRAYGFDLFVSRMSAPASARLTGWASYTWGKADRDSYGRRYPFEYDRRHAVTAVAGYRLTSRWELGSTIRVASGFPRTSPVGLRVAAAADVRDADGDGNLTELRPATDATGLLVYGVDYGPVANLNQARLPVFSRVDTRLTWRPRGPSGRWEYYLEVINLLNRRNAGAFDPVLEYDPASDRPRLVEERNQSLKRLPTLGLRVRF
jgi:vitamin B12 transporter